MKTKNKIQFAKTLTGIQGLDEVTEGGLPKGRPTLICGSAGCGKTLFGMQFLVKGITDYNEPGVFMSFEETRKDLAENVISLGFDVEGLIANNKLRIDHVRIERSEIEETGEFDLEGIFIRLDHAIRSIGAKRVVLDTIEAIFAGIDNASVLRSELRRLFSWLKEKGVTAIITAERGENTLTRQGLEEYVSDCVLLLDFRVIDQIATRRLRIVKYRGSTHGTNEYPFLIDESGISVLPITSLKLEHKTYTETISSGLETLDKLLERGGYFKGSSTLITGSAGTLKTTLAAYFAMASLKRKETVLYFSFEESPDQIVRNTKSIGLNFTPFKKSNQLIIHSSRPSLQGLELHLLVLHKLIEAHQPATVIIDPVSSLVAVGNISEVRSMLVRLMDMLKMKGINALFTCLTHDHVVDDRDATIDAVSSLADTWIKVRFNESNRQRIRELLIVKSRGMGHSDQAWNFIVTGKGVKLVEPGKDPVPATRKKFTKQTSE